MTTAICANGVIRTAAEHHWGHVELARRLIEAGEPHVAVRAVLIAEKWEFTLREAVIDYLAALGRLK